jgi:hypothetical protein
VAGVMRIPWSVVSPSLVLTQQSIAYALVPWSCAHQTSAPLHAVLAIAALLVGLGAVLSWRDWSVKRVDRHVDAAGQVQEARADFAAGLDFTLSIVSLLVVFAQWIAVFVLSPCL